MIVQQHITYHCTGGQCRQSTQSTQPTQPTQPTQSTQPTQPYPQECQQAKPQVGGIAKTF